MLALPGWEGRWWETLREIDSKTSDSVNGMVWLFRSKTTTASSRYVSELCKLLFLARSFLVLCVGGFSCF